MPCYCDYDITPEFVHETRRVARKQHMCCECGKIIAAGEEYITATGLWDGQFRRYKQCEACNDLMHSLMEAGQCPELGAVLDAHAEYLDRPGGRR